MLVHDETPKTAWKLAIVESLIKGVTGWFELQTFVQARVVQTDLSQNSIH